jgi:hypothetical protein
MSITDMNFLLQYPKRLLFIFPLVLLSVTKSFAQPANDECSAAISLTSSTSCINTSGTNVNATWNPSSLPAPGCGATDKSDVWYTFVAQASSQTITVSSAPAQVRLQLLSGTCGSFTSLFCGNTSIAATGLTVGTTYYIRVYTQNPTNGNFNNCDKHAPQAKDETAGAESLTSKGSCDNTAISLNLAKENAETPLLCFSAGT